MSETQRTRPAGGADDADFADLADQARLAFKPNYNDVMARARRHRGRRIVTSLAAIAVLVVAGGVAAHAITGKNKALPTAPIPRYLQIGPLGMSPMPTYTEINPSQHAWDVTAPDVPLTGMFPELMAGDLNHLYLPYQNCVTKNDCTAMVASSTDGGRSWRKFTRPGMLAAASGATLITASDMGDHSLFHASSDAGATWYPVEPAKVTALPVGWPLIETRIDTSDGSIMAFDPQSGAIDHLVVDPADRFRFDSDVASRLPRSAGIWRIYARSGPMPTPLPKGGFTLTSQLVLQVSQDGATWEDRTLPGNLGQPSTDGHGMLSNRMWSTDGRTVVFVVQDGKNQQLWVSMDGARTWTPGAVIPTQGPLMSLLTTRDGAILVEVGNDAYRSVDGGRTLQWVGPEMGSRAYAIPGGYAESTNDGHYAVWLSVNGGTWTFVPHPPVP